MCFHAANVQVFSSPSYKVKSHMWGVLDWRAVCNDEAVVLLRALARCTSEQIPSHAWAQVGGLGHDEAVMHPRGV